MGAKNKESVPAGKDAEKILEARKALKPTNLAEIREEISQLVSNEAFGMVMSMIESVHDGHPAAMKFLFEMISLYPIASSAEKAQDDGIAKALLDRWGLQAEPEAQTGYEGLKVEH